MNKFQIKTHWVLTLCFSIFLFISTLLNAQPVKSKVKSSNQPWQFGLRIGGSFDNAGSGDYKFGWKAGFVGEKRLVYNMYFQPSLSFQNKGYKYEIPFHTKGDVNAYLLEGVLGILIKFGDDRLSRGMYIAVSPFFTIGLGGKSEIEDLRDTTAINPVYYGKVTENTFSDYALRTLDLGFHLGVGYDFNRNVSLGGVYYFGLQKMSYYSNARWKGFQIHLSYFF